MAFPSPVSSFVTVFPAAHRACPRRQRRACLDGLAPVPILPAHLPSRYMKSCIQISIIKNNQSGEFVVCLDARSCRTSLSCIVVTGEKRVEPSPCCPSHWPRPSAHPGNLSGVPSTFVEGILGPADIVSPLHTLGQWSSHSSANPVRREFSAHARARGRVSAAHITLYSQYSGLPCQTGRPTQFHAPSCGHRTPRKAAAHRACPIAKR